MTATLLHMSSNEAFHRSADYFHLTIGRNDSIEKTREIVHRALAAGHYLAVGEFDESDLDRIWFAAQNGTLSPSWSKQPPEGVRPLGDGTVSGGLGYRSSMVGDIIVVDGKCHIVANAGFVDLGPLPVEVDNLPRPKDTGRRSRSEPDASPPSPRM